MLQSGSLCPGPRNKSEEEGQGEGEIEGQGSKAERGRGAKKREDSSVPRNIPSERTTTVAASCTAWLLKTPSRQVLQRGDSPQSVHGVIYKGTPWLMKLAADFRFAEVRDLGGRKVLLERRFPANESTNRHSTEAALIAPATDNLHEFQRLDKQNLPLAYGPSFYQTVLVHAGLSRLAAVDGEVVGSVTARTVRSTSPLSLWELLNRLCNRKLAGSGMWCKG